MFYIFPLLWRSDETGHVAKPQQCRASHPRSRLRGDVGEPLASLRGTEEVNPSQGKPLAGRKSPLAHKSLPPGCPWLHAALAGSVQSQQPGTAQPPSLLLSRFAPGHLRPAAHARPGPALTEQKPSSGAVAIFQKFVSIKKKTNPLPLQKTLVAGDLRRARVTLTTSHLAAKWSPAVFASPCRLPGRAGEPAPVLPVRVWPPPLTLVRVPSPALAPS